MISHKLTQYSPLIVLGLIAVVFYPSILDLVSVWMIWDQSMSHGIPLALMFGYFLWKSSPWPVQPSSLIEQILLALGLGLLSLTWALFYIAKIKILHQLMLLPILVAALGVMFGLKSVFTYRVLLALLIYVIPIWDYINDHLVQLSSLVVAELVRAINMPALIEGNNIQIPSGHIVIAGGCSGLRYLIISLCLAHTISYMNGYKEKGLLACLLVATALGLVTNWIRIFLLIYIGYSTEMKSSLMEDHEMFGWVLFGIICFIAIYFAPVVKVNSSTEKATLTPSKQKNIVWVVMLAALAIGPIMLNVFKVINIKPAQTLVFNNDYYHKEIGNMYMDILAPKPEVTHRLSAHNHAVAVQINEYIPSDTQTALVPYIPRTYDQELWKKISSKTININQKPASWQVLHNNMTGKTVAQIQWFTVGGYQVASVNKAKLYQIPAFFKRQMHFAMYTLQMECQHTSCHENEPALVEAASHLHQ